MKVLSVKQPWAWLITNGIKQVENRTWKTNHRGDLLIHACKEWDAINDSNDPGTVLQDLTLLAKLHGYEDVLNIDTWPQQPNGAIDLSEFRTGGIVGKCRVAACLPPEQNTREKLGLFSVRDHYAWIIQGAEELEFKPCKGKLGLWNYDYEPKREELLLF